MASSTTTLRSPISTPTSNNFLFTIRALIAISYFVLTILFYIRAPSVTPPGFVPSRSFPKYSKYRSVGVFGDAMVAMLGSTDDPFTIFVPSHAAFLNASWSMFRKDVELGHLLSDANSAAYAVMSHLLSFSAVPRPILSKHIPYGKEVVYETLSGFVLSMTRVRGRGLLVNNITCAETDLRRGRLVIHVLNGVVMDSEFELSMVQDTVLADDEDVKPDWDEEEQDENDESRV